MSVRVKENKRGLVTVSGLPRDVFDDLLHAASIRTQSEKLLAYQRDNVEAFNFFVAQAQWIWLLRKALDNHKTAKRSDLKLYIRVVEG